MSEREYMRLSSDEVALFDHVAGVPRACLNLPIKIELEEEIDEEKVIEAMRLTAKRLPFCHIRLHELEDGTTVQYYYDGEATGLDIVDMSDKTPEEIDKYMLKLSSQTFDNNCLDSQLFNFKLIRTPGGNHTIYFCGFHIIMDSVGVIYVISYFDKVYNALANGTELPPEGVGIEKHIEDSWAYHESDKKRKDTEWWWSQYDTEPHFASMNPKGSPEYIEGKNYGKKQTFSQLMAKSMPRKIPAELVNKVNEAALALNVSPQIYYMLALRTFLAYNSGCDDIIISTTGARRATIYQKNCGMTLAHMVDWRSFVDGNTLLKDALLQLSVSQKNVYRHINTIEKFANMTKARYNTPDDAMYNTVVFTYQAYFNTENTGLKFKAYHVNVGVSPYPLYMNVMPIDNSGDLWADYIYGNGYFLPENIEKFHAFMLKFVEKALVSYDKTVNQLRDECL